MRYVSSDGQCTNGYYAGWDGMYTTDIEECKRACLEEPRCLAISFCDPGREECENLGMFCLLFRTDPPHRARCKQCIGLIIRDILIAQATLAPNKGCQTLN